MNYLIAALICILEGGIFCAAFVLFAGNDERRRIALMGVFMIIEVVSVYFLYRGNEAVWPFFVHPYVSLMAVNITDYICIKRDRFEKFFLWPFYVLPAMSGFVLVWGWIFKIRLLPELFHTIF